VAVSLCVVCLVAGGVAWRWVGRPAPLEERIPMAADPTTSTPGGDPAAGDGSSASSAGTSSADASAEPQELVVHVVGAVGAPGVVRVGAGSRVVDAVVAAGGLAPGADSQRVNLAAPVVDGSRIVVPAVGQEVPVEVPTSLSGPVGGQAGSGSGGTGSSGAGSSGAGPAAPVELNTATAEQLDALPGVGPATAEAILAHRDAHGPFTSVEQLLDVRGIGEAKLESLRDLVVVR
jgi:competence protein ComEA